MMLSIETYKLRKANCNPTYKTYRYAGFDTTSNGETFEEQFNYAYKVLKMEIEEDRNNNDANLFYPIQITNVFLS